MAAQAIEEKGERCCEGKGAKKTLRRKAKRGTEFRVLAKTRRRVKEQLVKVGAGLVGAVVFTSP